jgi:hypothetical protein
MTFDQLIAGVLLFAACGGGFLFRKAWVVVLGSLLAPLA